MRFLRFAILSAILVLCCALVHAQGGTSMGTEFWTAYMSNTNPPNDPDQPSQMFLYITSDVNTTGKIEIADGSFSSSFSVTANAVTIVQIPASAYISANGVYNKGVHITSLNPISIYAHIFADRSSGATLLLPVNTMGKDYYSINYTQAANETASSALMVIATEDSTTIQVTPMASNKYVKASTVSLNKGQVYELLGPTDLTGTRIQSVSTGTSTCKKIAVFSGSTRILIGCPNTSSDNLFQQVYPTSAWGDNYITVPLKDRPYDVFRVVLSDANTVLQVNGQTIDPTNFAKNMFYEFNATTPNTITANKPVQVAQYAVSQNNGLNCKQVATDTGDPEMIFLTPLEQTLNHVTLYSTSNYQILQSYINVLMPFNGASSFKLDGVPYTSFTKVPGNPDYGYAQIPVTNGTHNIRAGVGFNAIAYGFGADESYGYAAGANLANLDEYIAFQNLQTDSLQYNGCTNEKYNLQLTLPYKTTQITWNFNNGTAPVVQTNPVPAGTAINGTQTLYIYKYPKSPVSFNKRGNYTINATVFNTSSDDCGSNEQVTFNFNISDLPAVNFDVDNTYVGTATAFKDETVSDTTIKTWNWDFGDGQSSGLQNPQHAYTSPGKYTVTETVTDVDGCSSLLQKTIDINIVVSPLKGTIITCQGTASSSPSIDSFTVTAGSLTAPLIIAAPADFELSLSPDNGYAKNITLSPSGGVVNNVTVYIRTIASAPAGNLSEMISITSAGVTGVKFNVSAIVNTVPVLQQVADVAYKNQTITPGIAFSSNGTTFSWTNDTPSIGLAASGNGNIPSFLATNNTGTTDITANISVIAHLASVAYIANSDSNKISVINTTTNTVAGTINVPGYSEGIAASPRTNRIYLSDYKGNMVDVVDAGANAVTSTINVGQGPEGICVSPDGTRIFVANSASNTVSVIDAASNAVIATIAVGYQPLDVITSYDGTTLYVSNSISGSISVINTQTNQVTNTISVGNYPLQIILSPDGGTLYAANYNANTVSVVNLATGQVTTKLICGTYPSGLAISADGKSIYVTNLNANTVTVVDVSTGSTIATIPVNGNPYGISINQDGSLVYVTSQHSGVVSIIDTKTNKIVSNITTVSGSLAFGNFIVSGDGCSGTPMNFHITVYPTPPVKITATGTLTDLLTTYGTPSATTSFTVSGQHLVSPISITAPAGFEISTDKNSFSAVISLGDTGVVAPTIIYVRLKATTPAGTYPDDVISIAAKNADTLKTMVIPLGTVQAAPLTVQADDKFRLYGFANPALTVTYSGFVNNESASDLTKLPIVSTTANAQSPVGYYVITADSAMSTNYVFTYLPGTLTVAPSGVNIPNTFTPNGDGINDTWNIKYLDYFTKCSVDIFNRYGQKLYHSIGYAIPWDGTFKGKPLPTGTYYYIINLENGSPLLSGFVAIIR